MTAARGSGVRQGRVLLGASLGLAALILAVVRLQGFLVPGSLVATERCLRTFRLRELETSTPVPREFVVIDESCGSPGFFCDLPGLKLELTVEGEVVLAKPYVAFSARQVLLKCTGRYDSSLPRAACLAASEEQRKRCAPCGRLPKD